MEKWTISFRKPEVASRVSYLKKSLNAIPKLTKDIPLHLHKVPNHINNHKNNFDNFVSNKTLDFIGFSNCTVDISKNKFKIRIKTASENPVKKEKTGNKNSLIFMNKREFVAQGIINKEKHEITILFSKNATIDQQNGIEKNIINRAQRGDFS